MECWVWEMKGPSTGAEVWWEERLLEVEGGGLGGVVEGKEANFNSACRLSVR